MRQRIQSFMRNRYGMDDLNFALMFLYFIIWLFNLFFRNQIVSYIILMLIVIIFFNIIKRNLSRKDNHYYAICRNCRQTLRLPKGKGNIEVTCPKCGYHFDKRT